MFISHQRKDIEIVNALSHNHLLGMGNHRNGNYDIHSSSDRNGDLNLDVRFEQFTRGIHMLRLAMVTVIAMMLAVLATVGCQPPIPTTPAPTPTALKADEVYATLTTLEKTDPAQLEYKLKKNHRVRIRGKVTNTEYDKTKTVTIRIGPDVPGAPDDYFLCEMDPQIPSDHVKIGEEVTLRGEYKTILSKAEGLRSFGKSINPLSYDDRVVLKDCKAEN